MEKYYLSYGYGYGYIKANRGSDYFSVPIKFEDNFQSIEPVFKPIINYTRNVESKNTAFYNKKAYFPLFIIETDDCFTEVFTGKKIRKVIFSEEKNDATEKNLILKGGQLHAVGEFCLLDISPISISEFSNILKKVTQHKSTVKHLINEIEENYKNAPIWSANAKRTVICKKETPAEKKTKENFKKNLEKITSIRSNDGNSKSKEDESLLSKARVLLESKKNELLSVDVPKNNVVSNNFENDPLGEYIARQEKQKRK